MKLQRGMKRTDRKVLKIRGKHEYTQLERKNATILNLPALVDRLAKYPTESATVRGAKVLLRPTATRSAEGVYLRTNRNPLCTKRISSDCKFLTWIRKRHKYFLGHMFLKIPPVKTSGKTCIIQSGDIPSPRQIPIDKQKNTE